MKLVLFGLILNALSLSAMANSKPTLKHAELGTYHGKDLFRSCTLTLEENHRGQIVATFTRGDHWFKTFAVAPDTVVMTSASGQTWQDFTISGITHAGVTFNSAYDLTPVSYVVSEGRSSKVIKCSGLKKEN